MAHIRYFNKITSTLKYKDVPETLIKLMLFLFSIDGRAWIWLDKEPPRSILTWDDLVSKFINHFVPPSKTTNLRNEISNFQQRFEESFYEAYDRFKDLLQACPHHGFTELHQFDTFYNGLNPSDQLSLNSAACGNLLERSAQDVLKIIENKSKVRHAVMGLILYNVNNEKLTTSQLPFEKIEVATKKFKTCIRRGGYGWVYKGVLSIDGKDAMVAVKRLNEQFRQGLKDFFDRDSVALWSTTSKPHVSSQLLRRGKREDYCV
ncbi:reverse transcriptase domain-containing protein [Tanacetum coccineum]